DCDHFGARQTGVDVEVFQRSVEARDMLFEAKGLPVEAARHVEHCIALEKALVAERDHDLALSDDPAVEPGDALVGERHLDSFASEPPSLAKRWAKRNSL